MNFLNRLPEIFTLRPPTHLPSFPQLFPWRSFSCSCAGAKNLGMMLFSKTFASHLSTPLLNPQIYFQAWNHPKSSLKRRPFTLLTSSSPACWTGSICPSERWVWAGTVSAAGGTGRQTGSPLLDWWAGRAGSAHWTSAAAGSPCWTDSSENR